MTDQASVLGISEESRRSVVADVAFYRAVLDALPASIAVVDSYGTIVAVNSAWRRFGEANGLRDPDYCVGANYFAECRTAPEPAAREAYAGIHDVLSGARRSFKLLYPCHGPKEERWFALQVTPLPNHGGFVALAHEDISEQVRAERELDIRRAARRPRSR